MRAQVTVSTDPPESGLIYLNNSYPDILGPNKEDNWVVLLQDAAQDGRKKCAAYKISNTIEEAKVDFTLSLRVTGLELDLGVEKGEKPLSKFFLRKRTIFFQYYRTTLNGLFCGL
jgi:hypothetical protein